MMGRRWALVVAVLAISGVVRADTAPTIMSFTLPGDKSFIVPLPAGYCVPTGAYETAAKMTASADPKNLTNVSFIDCADAAAGGELNHFGILKTPFELVSTDVDRAEILAELKPSVDTKALQDLNDAASNIGSESLTRVYGRDIKVSLDVRALDSDDKAVYYAGTADLSDAERQKKLACAYAISVVRKRVIVLYLYAAFHDARDVTAVLSAVKDLTAAFVKANPEG